MTLHLHTLEGCRTAPLAHYLKGLGVLRLVSEQREPEARGRWRGDVFELQAELDASEVERFFLDDYTPSPLLSPWNGGSGFYSKDAKQGIDALRTAAAQRFAPYRKAIAVATAMLAGLDERPSKADKTRLQARCRAEWPTELLPWFNAAVVLTDADVSYPALLGTGGNDGRLDFTNNFMQRLVELFDPDTGAALSSTARLLRHALWRSAELGMVDRAIGQFHPGAAGGANGTDDFTAKARVNPWDFVLMLEGALTLQVAAVRRLDGQGLPQASAPFAVRGNAADYGSACRSEESSRGEQWMPLWNALATYDEVRALFREGRLQSSSGRAVRALDAASAIATHGVARGVTAFQRFGYLERNGQSNLAVSLGRWTVTPRPEVRLLADLDSWVRSLRAGTGDENRDPASLRRHVRMVESSMMALYREGGRADRWRTLLRAMAQAEQGMIRRPRHTVSRGLWPIPPLRPGWIAGALDPAGGPTEVRLAAAIALQSSPFDRKREGGVRRHLVPLAGDRFATHGDALARDPGVVWKGLDLVSDMTAIVARRLMEATRDGDPALPLTGQIGAQLSDIAAFLDDDLDPRLLSDLVRAFCAVRWRKPSDLQEVRRALLRPAPGPESIDVVYALFRTVYCPTELQVSLPHRAGGGSTGGSERVTVRLESQRDPQPFRLLAAGRVDRAARVAAMRLIGRGARPKIRGAGGDRAYARRVAASLAIPVHRGAAERLLVACARPDQVPVADEPALKVNPQGGIHVPAVR